MNPAPFAAFYKSDLQSVYLLGVLPLAFLVFRLWRRNESPGIDAETAPFIRLYTWVFAVETLLDPLATGPLSRILGIADEALGTVLMFCFVWLGDFRVFSLVFGLGHAGKDLLHSQARAALWTFAVPAFAGGLYFVGLKTWCPDIHGQWLWVVYEVAFLMLALALRGRDFSQGGRSGALANYQRALFSYVALYYGLWASADLLILLGEFDRGWALRVIPNQLYYGLWIPFVWVRFFRSTPSVPRVHPR